LEPSQVIRRTGMPLCMLFLISSAVAGAILSVPHVEAGGDFLMSVSPNLVAVNQGRSVQCALRVQSLNGFSEAVSFSLSYIALPSGFAASISPSPITPPTDGSAYSVVTINVASTVAAGSYSLLIYGSGGGITRSTVADVRVRAAGTASYAISVSPSYRVITAGGAMTFTVTLTSTNNFDDYINLLLRELPYEASGYFSPGTVRVAPSGPATSTLLISTSSDLAEGIYYWAIYGVPVSYYYYVSNTSIVTVSVTEAADFELSISPSTKTIAPGGSAEYTASLVRTGGFASSVALSISGLPDEADSSFNPESIRGSETSELTIDTTPDIGAGNYTFTVTGIGGGKTRTETAKLVVSGVSDFTLEVSPQSQTASLGQSAIYVVAITSQNNFNSPVALSLTSYPAGLTWSFNPASVTPPKNGVQTSVLTITLSSSVVQGSYVLTVVGAGGGLTHSEQIVLNVGIGADFSISAEPSTLSVTVGSGGTSTIRVTSINNFNSQVRLELSNVPSGISASLNPVLVIPQANSFAISILSVNVPAGATGGTYTLLVTGTSGSLSRAVTVTLNVRSGCLIATATYGSELSPEVQFLREFRDRDVLTTFAGSQFMTIFNQFYYSFSPSLAQSIAENEVLRAVTKLLLYPFIGILHLTAMTHNAFPFNVELGTVAAGLVASSLIGLVYFSPIAVCSLAMLKRYRRLTLKDSHLKIIGIIWLGNTALIAASETLASPIVMMASTASFTLFTAVSSALAVATALLRLLNKRPDINCR